MTDRKLICRLEAAAVRGWPATIARPMQGGWLLRATPGIDRGRSNNALTPCRPLAEQELDPAIERVCEFAAEHSITPGIQVSPLELHGELMRRLDDRGWRRQWRTVVMAGPAQVQCPPAGTVSAEDHASREWLRAWERCEPGRDVDAHAQTVFSILRGGACFARIGSEAVGIGVVHDRLADMYCIAVDPDRRRQGLGTAIVAALLERVGSAAQLGYLQVEERNAAARAMYGALGFSERYRYCHRLA